MTVPSGVVRDVTDVNDSVGGDYVSSYAYMVLLLRALLKKDN